VDEYRDHRPPTKVKINLAGRDPKDALKLLRAIEKTIRDIDKEIQLALLDVDASAPEPSQTAANEELETQIHEAVAEALDAHDTDCRQQPNDALPQIDTGATPMTDLARERTQVGRYWAKYFSEGWRLFLKVKSLIPG